MEVTKANLATYLAGLTPSATPYPIEITETVASDWNVSGATGTVGNIINTSTPSGVYLDLGLTVIPNGVTNIVSTFFECTPLTTAPIIPSSVTSLTYAFYQCTSLTTAPIIPSNVAEMDYTFYLCTSLTTAPLIPNSVTNMQGTFRGCTALHTIQNFAVAVDNCNMTNAFQNCPALANIYVTTLTESSWHLLHTNTGATGTDYTIYNPDGTVAGSGTVAGTSQVLTLYGKSDELVISANITPTLAEETATSQVQWHKSGLPYDDELMIFNAKNPDTVISNFITVNRAGEEFLGNASTATTASTADKWKTARNITISDADGTNTGTAVSVDGSENETLKLPSTIKANLSGNATTATKLATARKINGVDFDGSANITVADSTKAPTSHASSAVTYGVASASNYGHAMASGASPLVNGTASAGTDNGKFAREAHVHPTDTTREPTFTKNTAFNKNFETTASNIKANGTQSVGTSSNVPRADHVHPLQTSVSGNAGTATKLATARKIHGVDFDGTADVYDTYSTTEKRIGTWIDGKPIYRKVINFGTLPNATTKNVAHGISNLGKVIKLEGVASSASSNFPLPHADPTGLGAAISFLRVGGNIEIITRADRTSLTAIVIIEYTKTTD